MNLLYIIQTKRLVDMWIYHEFVVYNTNKKACRYVDIS